nr:hypothetical protein [Tanacetum cinerariifolium]
MKQTTTPIPTPPITTDAPNITTDVPEFDALSAIQLRVAKLEKDVYEPKKINHSVEALAFLKSQVLISASEIHKVKNELAEKQKMPKYTIKSTNKVELKEYDQKSTLYQTMHENKSFNRNLANHALYNAFIEALIEDEMAMDKGVADTLKNHKRQHDDDDDDPSARPNQGKAPLKSSRTGKSTTAKEPIKELTAEVEIDYAVNTATEDVVHDANPPHDDSTQAKDKALMQDWFKNLQGLLLLIRNGTSIDHLTQEILVGPAYNLLKGTCTSSIELEYNTEECFKGLTDRLNWNNPEGDHCLFDVTKPLPLKGCPSHLTIAVEYFFNNDLDIDLEYNFKECFNALTDTLDCNNQEGDRYLFDLSKPLPLQGPPGHRTVDVDNFFNNDLDYLKTFDPEVPSSMRMTKMHQWESSTGVKDVNCGTNLRAYTRTNPTRCFVMKSQKALKGLKDEKRNVRINGEKKAALRTLRQKLVTMEILLEPTSNKLCG